MKFDKKIVSTSIATFLVIASSILFYVILTHFGKIAVHITRFFEIISPVIIGFVIAYFLSPVVAFFENKIFKSKSRSKKAQKRLRTLSIVLSYALFAFLVFGFFKLIIPEISETVPSIIQSYPKYQKNIEDWGNNIIENNPEIKKLINDNYPVYVEKFSSIITDKVFPKLNTWIMSLTSGLVNALKAVLNFLIGIILSIYLIANKEVMLGQCKKAIYAMMKRSTANNFIHNIRYTNKTFQNFFVGKIADSILIGLICFIAMTLLQLNYAALVSVIIGVTNIIPLFGPFIGAIPSAFIIFMAEPIQCLYFIILVICLQQFDGNILGPKILGSSTGLSGFWVIFAITLFGGWFGLAGWLIGVPLFAVFYNGFKSYVNAKLAEKDLESDTEKYLNVNYIDNDHNYIEIPTEEVKELASKRKLINPIHLFKKHDHEVENNNEVKEDESSNSENNKHE